MLDKNEISYNPTLGQRGRLCWMACFSATLGQLPYACISTHTEAGRVQWPDSEPKNTSSCRMLVKLPWGWMFVLVCAYVHVKALHVMQNNTKKQGAVIAVYKI